MFDTFENIVAQMNRAGKSEIPFLFAINFDKSEGFFVANPKEQTNILFDINGQSNIQHDNNILSDYVFECHPIGLNNYKEKYDAAIGEMTKRGVDLINLTQKTPLSTSLSLEKIFKYSKAKYRLLVPDKFVCFSPEIFVRTSKGKIYSYPMKGTISAGVPNAREIIINSKKEIEEHRTAVDLISEDLSKVSSEVAITRFRYIDEISNHRGKLLQVSSEVVGTLSDDFFNNIGTHISNLLPAGSIAGYPRGEAIKIIDKIENETRGYYTGIVGYFDGRDIDCGVLIRFIEQDNDRLYFRSGGGITLNSVCEDEYREIEEKIYLPF